MPRKRTGKRKSPQKKQNMRCSDCGHRKFTSAIGNKICPSCGGNNFRKIV